MIHFRTVRRWDGSDEFDEYAHPQRPLSQEADRILDVTNEQLAHWRAPHITLENLHEFILK